MYEPPLCSSYHEGLLRKDDIGATVPWTKPEWIHTTRTPGGLKNNQPSYLPQYASVLVGIAVITSKVTFPSHFRPLPKQLPLKYLIEFIPKAIRTLINTTQPTRVCLSLLVRDRNCRICRLCCPLSPLGGSDRKQQQVVSSSGDFCVRSWKIANPTNWVTWTVVVWRFCKGQVAEAMWAASGSAASCSGLQSQRWSGKWGCLNRDTPGSAFARYHRVFIYSAYVMLHCYTYMMFAGNPQISFAPHCPEF